MGCVWLVNHYWDQFLALLPAETERLSGFAEPLAFGCTSEDATERPMPALDEIKTATGSVLC
jgi:hypothetical protein